MKSNKVFLMMVLVVSFAVLTTSSAYAHCGKCGTDEPHAEKSSIDGHMHDAEGYVEEVKSEIED